MVLFVRQLIPSSAKRVNKTPASFPFEGEFEIKGDFRGDKFGKKKYAMSVTGI